MPFTYAFKKKFAQEFAKFPIDQQDKVLDFVAIFSAHGLVDFSRYPGKISPSWTGNADLAAYNFAVANDLWHYHIGIPTYVSNHPKFKTSDWVLHFQWIGCGTHIDLLDLYSHYRSDGTFYLPTADYMV